LPILKYIFLVVYFVLADGRHLLFGKINRSYVRYENKKTVLSQGNRAMPQLFFSV